jgi:Ca2+-binding RTX toxin-like protein
MPTPNLIGSNVVINSGSLAGSQDDASVVGMADGRILYTWRDGTSTIRFKIYNPDGTVAIDETVVNATQAGSGTVEAPVVTALLGGGFAVAWDYNTGGDRDIWVKTYNSALVATGPETRANVVLAGNQTEPSIAAVGDGFILTWTESNTTVSQVQGSSSAVMARYYFPNGLSVAAPARISDNFGGDFSSSVAVFNTPNDQYINIVWDDNLGQVQASGENEGIFGFETGGANAQGYYTLSGSTGGGDGRYEHPDIDYDGRAGYFMGVWTFRPASGANPEIAVRGYGTDGFWSQARANTTDLGPQFLASATAVAGTASDGFLVIWHDGRSDAGGADHDVLGQLYTSDGLPDGNEFVITSNALTFNFITDVDVARLLDGRLMVTWSGGPATSDIYSQIVDPRFSAVNWAGTGLGEHFIATSFNDTLRGGGGPDTLNGADGFDTVTYDLSTIGVVINLFTGQGFQGEAQGDVYANIEFAVGSLGPDAIIGTSAANFLDGSLGNDIVYGNAGNDTLIGGLGLDSLFGEDGNDDIFGFDDNDSLFGGAGNDTLQGELGNDQLFGDDGNDSLLGADGNDTLIGGAGADQLLGSGGQDTARYDFSAAAVSVNLINGTGSAGDAAGDVLVGIENLVGSALNDTLLGGTGANFLDGIDGNDSIRANSGNDTVFGGNGNDTVFGEGDNDLIFGFFGADLLWGGSGNDTIRGERDADVLLGEAGNDVLWGDEENDTLYGFSGNDILLGGTGNDTMFGEADNDTLYGWFGADEMWGGLGDDRLFGEQDNDTLLGQEGADFLDGVDGNDTLYGFTGIDTLLGGNGNDLIFGEGDGDIAFGFLGSDTLWGGDGNDTLFGEQENDSLFGDAGNDILLGGEGNDSMYGFVGDDTMYGFTGNDLMFGEDGIDIMLGEDGNDFLGGQAGNDWIVGGRGADTMWGDEGDDFYVFNINDLQNGVQDVINSFGELLGNNDRIRFEGIASGSVSVSQQGVNALVSFNGTSGSILITSFLASNLGDQFIFV